MKFSEIAPYIDHTILKPTTTKADIEKLCQEAAKYNFASICIPPSYVDFAKKYCADQKLAVRIATVVGFPLGYTTTEVKKLEAKDCIQNGADEIDMVINICAVKNNDWDKVEYELEVLRAATSGYILKVIIETCYLTENEKIKLCALVSKTKADYIKTSTGFGTAGADLADIALFKKHLDKNVKIKASGGIRTKSDMEKYIESGCSRLGTSNGLAAKE